MGHAAVITVAAGHGNSGFSADGSGTFRSYCGSGIGWGAACGIERRQQGGIEVLMSEFTVGDFHIEDIGDGTDNCACGGCRLIWGSEYC